jgi:hypothetical protein
VDHGLKDGAGRHVLMTTVKSDTNNYRWSLTATIRKLSIAKAYFEKEPTDACPS